MTDKTAGKEYAADKLTLDLVFDQANVGKEFKGVSGKTYVLSLSSDAKTLQANVKGETAKQDIVKILALMSTLRRLSIRRQSMLRIC